MKHFFLLLLIAAMTTVGCKKQSNRIACDGSAPTWNGQVLDIVATSCWGSDCHGANARSTDYTTYANIRPVLLNGKFENRVLDQRSMPQNDFLADSTLAKLQCWLENGFPES